MLVLSLLMMISFVQRRVNMLISKEKALDEMLELYGLAMDKSKTVKDIVDFVERVCVGLSIPTDPEIYDEQAFYFKQTVDELLDFDENDYVNSQYTETFIKGLAFDFVHDLHEFLEVE